MAPPTFSTLVSGYSFFEGPRWHAGRLWLSDFYTRQVIAVGMDGTVETIAEVPGQPSGLGWLPDGRLLVVSMRDRKLLRRRFGDPGAGACQGGASGLPPGRDVRAGWAEAPARSDQSLGDTMRPIP